MATDSGLIAGRRQYAPRMDEGSGDPTQVGGELTELAGVAEADTMSAYAWSEDDASPEVEPPRRWPAWVTAGAVAASLVVVGVAAWVAMPHLRSAQAPVSLPTPAAQPSPAPPVPSSATAHPAALPAPPPQPPAPVALSASGGSVYVKTISGKTVCQVTAGNVACNVDFTRATPTVNGMPASGIEVTSRGAWQWLFGDPGNPDYNTLSYGETYRAIGWTITPTTGDTTFMNDATGHGMTVSVEGFSTF